MYLTAKRIPNERLREWLVVLWNTKRNMYSSRAIGNPTEQNHKLFLFDLFEI